MHFSWPKRLNYAVLVFLNLLVDKWGVLFRDQLLNRLLNVVPIFIGRLGLDTADTSIEVCSTRSQQKKLLSGTRVGLFRQTDNVGFPGLSAEHPGERAGLRGGDCCRRLSAKVKDPFYARHKCFRDLEKMSTTRPGFVIPSSKAPLFAKLAVIAELSSTVIPSQPNDSKRSKVLTPLEVGYSFFF